MTNQTGHIYNSKQTQQMKCRVLTESSHIIKNFHRINKAPILFTVFTVEEM